MFKSESSHQSTNHSENMSLSVPLECLCCALPFDLVERRPFILHGNHIFCESCIKQFPDVISINQSPDQAMVRCPLCQLYCFKHQALVNHSILDMLKSTDRNVHANQASPSSNRVINQSNNYQLYDESKSNHDDNLSINQSVEKRQIRFPVRRCDIHRSTTQSTNLSINQTTNQSSNQSTFDDNVLTKYCIDCDQFICLYCETDDSLNQSINQTIEQPITSHKDHRKQTIADAWIPLSKHSITVLSSVNKSLEKQQQAIDKLNQSIHLINGGQQYNQSNNQSDNQTNNQTKIQSPIEHANSVAQQVTQLFNEKTSTHLSSILLDIENASLSMKQRLQDQSASMKSSSRSIQLMINQLQNALLAHDFLSVYTVLGEMSKLVDQINQSINQSINQIDLTPHPLPENLSDGLDKILNKWFASLRSHLITPMSLQNEQNKQTSESDEASQSTSQSSDQSVDQSINQSIDQPIDHSDNQPILQDPALVHSIRNISRPKLRQYNSTGQIHGVASSISSTSESSYQPIGNREQPFNTHESSTLLTLVKQNTPVGGHINWRSVAAHWYRQWQQEQISQPASRLVPRNKNVLRGKYDAMLSVLTEKLSKHPEQNVTLEDMVKDSNRWTLAENDLFLQILEQNPDIGVSAFNVMWVEAGYQALHPDRFYNKIKTINRARKTAATRATQPGSNKKQKLEQ